MFQKIPKYLHAKYRAFAPVSCFDTPRGDVLRGWRRWRWLVRQRRAGRLIEPSVRVQGDLARLDERLILCRGTCLDQGCILWLGDGTGCKGSIHLAERVYVGPYAFLGTSSHKLEIGEDTMIGAHGYIITENHGTARKDIPYARQGYVGADVTIGKNVWVGCHVTILPGVTIGDHAIIGAGAVVTKNVSGGETWAGVPARKIEK
jgi:acetyltransferase-like isoleucine patch superfamily enzyme